MSVLLTVLTLHPYYSGCPTETWTHSPEHCKVGALGTHGKGGEGGDGGFHGRPYLGYGHVGDRVRAKPGPAGKNGGDVMLENPNPNNPKDAPDDPYDAVIAKYVDWYLSQARDPEKAALLEAFPGLP